ncbi:MAG TPA: hypothetical protein VGO93_31390 [Candidatus Xenobia bacterium]|jgi:hypothetical protein
METTTTRHIDKTQKSLAILAIMRRIEEKRKKRPRRRVTADVHPPDATEASTAS